MAKTTVPQYLSATTSIIDSGDATAITIDGSENVAIGGGTNHDGAALLISHGDSGVTTFSDNADELVIENSTNAGISILTPNNASGSIIFGDSDDDDIGKIVYNHNDNSLTFTATTVATSGNATVGGTLGVTGVISPTTHIDMPDNAIIKLGTGDDLQLWHDGTNNIIRATGDLLIQRNTTPRSAITITDSTGAVDLAYGGSTKLTTASGGVTVTGDIANASGDMTIDVAGDIILDADGGDITFKDGGTSIASFKNSGGTFIIKSEASDSDIYFNGNDGGTAITAMAIDMSEGGRVGIGTTSPSNTLSVVGVITSGDFTSVGAGGTPADLNTAEVGRGYINLARDDTANVRQITFGKNGAVHSYLETTSSGLNIGGANVGIGTTSPSRLLDINSTANDAYPLKIRGNIDNDGGYTGIVFGYESDTTAYEKAVIHVEGTSGSVQPDMHFLLHSGANSSNATISDARLSILNGGNVGIGTASPGYPLHVVGSTIGLFNSGADATLYLGEGESGGQYGWIKWESSNDTIRIGTQTGGDTITVNESGNVGIGTASPGTLLHIEGDSGGGGGSTSPVLLTVKDADGGGSWVIGDIFAATDYVSSDGSGVGAGVRARTGLAMEADGGGSSKYMIQTCASAGTLTDRFTITSDGKVGIGKFEGMSGITGSSNNPSYLLHIQQHGAPVNDLTMIRLTNGHGLAGSDLSAQDTHIDFEFKDSNDNVVPQARISAHVGDGGDANTQAKEGKGYLTFHCSNTTTTSGEHDPTEHFRIAHDGTLTATDTTIGSNSDKRLKKKIKKYSGGLDLINQLQPRTFEWKVPEKRKQGTRRGFVAQEILEIDDYWIDEIGLTNKNDPEYKYVKDTEKVYTSKLTDKDAMYVSAIKEMKETIDALEARITELESS